MSWAEGWHGMLAEVELPFQGTTVHVPKLLIRDIILFTVLGVALFVLLAFLIYWVRSLIRHWKPRAGGEKVYRDSEPAEEPLENEESSVERRRYKFRRRRRGHRSRNPTLSETGGLPPARPEEPGEPR